MHQKAVVALAGVLLVAGAGTGTTLAAWHAQRQVDLGAVRSGSVGLTVNGTARADLGPLPGLHAGEATTVSPVVTNTAPPGAKDLSLAVYLDGASTSVPAIDSALTIDARTQTSGCAPAGSGAPLSSFPDSRQLGVLGPQQSLKLCVTLRLPAGASEPPQGLSGTLTLVFRGQQVTP